jgi:hypothetical protein
MTRKSMKAAAIALFLMLGWVAVGYSDDKPTGETLYNGIQLPKQWPPKLPKLTREPMPVPYLKHPPAVIPIDVGRQLFVDNFLVEKTTLLARTFHRAQYHPANPVIKPDKPWEQLGRFPTAMVFSDGVWYDPADKLFKAWYMGGYCMATCYATSTDGIHWTKPSLDVEPGTNIVQKLRRDSTIVWLDQHESDPQKQYKLFVIVPAGKDWGQKNLGMRLYCSPDGIHWGKPVAASFTPRSDRNSVFYNPFRKVWVFSERKYLPPPDVGRARHYWEHPDAAEGLNRWAEGEQFPWTCADRLDPRALADVDPELYNLDAVAYESLMLGFFSIWQSDPYNMGQTKKRCELLLGYSRDGFHWHRPDRIPFAGVSETDGAWNWANIQSAGGGCLVVGNKLYFYVSGREKSRWDGHENTGLATLRRDGFASMDAGDKEGMLCTRPVRFSGKRLFVNVDAPKGDLKVEILDQKGNVIEPFSKANCTPISADKTLAEVRWQGAEDLSALAGKPVQFRFYLRMGSLYAFWVSPESTGASHGYVAAGGPGFTGPTDTVGNLSP